MKLHLPKMLGTALRAALSSLSFVSVATGTLTALVLAGAATQATAASPYIWTGAVSSVWDTTTENWTQDGTPTTFKSGTSSAVTFNSTRNKNVTIDSTLTAGAMIVSGDYSFSGTGKLTVASLNGTANIKVNDGLTITSSGETSVASGGSFSSQGNGLLSLTTVKAAGQVKLGGNVKITGGSGGQGDGTNQKGLCIYRDGAVTILDGTTTVSGAIYMGHGPEQASYQGYTTLTVGNGLTAAKLVAARLEAGDANASGGEEIVINREATLVLLSTQTVDDYKTTGLILSEWGNESALTVGGTLLAKGTQVRSGDKAAKVVGRSGSLIAVGGFSQRSGKKASDVRIEDGAKLVLGNGGITQTTADGSNFSIGSSEVGISAASTTISTSVQLDGTVTFNTNQYVWAGDSQSISEGTTAGTFNISGGMTGTGGIIATGKGTVSLTGANTFAGAVTVDGATLKISGSGSVGSGIGSIHVKAGTFSVEKTIDLSSRHVRVDAGGKLTVKASTTLTLGPVTLAESIQNSGTVAFAARGTVVTDNLEVKSAAESYVDETGAASDQGFLQGSTQYVTVVEGGKSEAAEGAYFSYKGKQVSFDAATGHAIVGMSEDTDWSLYQLKHDKPDFAAMVDFAESHGGRLTTIEMSGGDLQVSRDFSHGTVKVSGSGSIGADSIHPIGTVIVYGTGEDGLEFNQTFTPVGNLIMQSSGMLKGSVKPVNFTVRSGAEATLNAGVDATNLTIEQGASARVTGMGISLMALNGTVDGNVGVDTQAGFYVGPVGTSSGTVTVNGMVDIASSGKLGIRQNGNLIVNGRLRLESGSAYTHDGTLQVNAPGELIAGNGIDLGTLNVKGKLTAEGDNATITSAGGSVANLNLAAGQTLVSSSGLTLEANNGTDGNISVTGVLTAAGNLHLDNVQASAVALTGTASLIVDDALNAGSVTLNRINRDKVYVTAGSLTAGNTDFVVSVDAVEGLRLSDGMTLTLADLGYTLAGSVSVNGGDRISKAGSDYAYYISQDTVSKDIILTAREKESDYIWKGGDGEWAVDTNWSGGSAPDEEAWVQLRSGSGTITLDGTEEIARMSTYSGTSYTLSGEGLLDIAGTLAVQGSSIQIGSGADAVSAKAAETRLSDGSSLTVSDGAHYYTGALVSEGTGAVLNGDITVYGYGGVYRGSYGNAHVSLLHLQGEGGAVSQALVADRNLSVSGFDATATLLYDGDAHLGAIDTQCTVVVLNSQTEDAGGKCLTIDGTASITNGALVFGLDPEATASTLGTRKAPVVLSAENGLDLTGSEVVIGQGGSYSKGALVIDTKGREEDLVLAYVGGEGTGADTVTLSGKLFNKYYTNARLVDGAVLVDLRSGYFEQDVVQSTEHNTRAGAAMLDEALKYTNPQVNNPDGELAGIMDALEDGHISHSRVQQIAAGISGASTAALGMAASQDVDRQLRAIRNRTTTMGVGDGADRTGMPFVNAWINAEADYRQLDADNTLAGYKMTSWGGTLGFDVDCTPRFTFGLAVSALLGDFSAKSAETAEGDLDRTYLTAFAHYTHRAWAHTLIATGGWYDTELERSINYGTRTANTKGDSDGSAIGLMYEVGYTIALTEDATTCIQPLFNVSWRHSSIGGYSEKGSETALTVGDMEANVTTFALGARLQSAYGAKPCNRSSLFEARALAKLAAGDKDLDGKVNLSGLPTHTVKSAETGNFGVEIGAGVTIPMLRDNDALFLDLSAEFWSGFANVNGVIGYRVNF